MQKQQMEAQLQQQIEREKNQMKGMELELKKQELALKERELYINAQMDKLKIESDMANKRYDTDTEAGVEMSYLQQKDQIDKINAQLKQIELMLSNTRETRKINLDEMSSGRDKVKIKDDSKTRK
jgi:hypothetical protein